jgi:hypothetical protein
MNKEQRVRELCRQWEEVSGTQVPHDPEASGVSPEEKQQQAEDFRKDKQQQELDLLLLEGGSFAFAAAETPESEEYEDDDEDEEGSDDSEQTINLREDLYGMIYAQLVMLDAMDVFAELVVKERQQEEGRGMVFNNAILRAIERLLDYYRERDAWRIAEHPLFQEHEKIEFGLRILEYLTAAFRRSSVQERVRTRIAHALSDGGIEGRSAAMDYLQLWRLTGNAQDLVIARELCERESPEEQVSMWRVIAGWTWEDQDVQRAFDSILYAMTDERRRAHAAMSLMDAMAIEVNRLQANRTLMARFRQIAERLPNRNWRAMLLRKLEEAAAPFLRN